MDILIKLLILLGSLVISYLFGSISWAIIISKLFYKKDVREFGSKNAGGTNMTRTFGKKIGFLVIFLDMSKIIVAYWLILLLLRIPVLRDHAWVAPTVYISAIGAALGHSFPIFYNFKGGKSVSILAGFILATSPMFTFIGLSLFLIIMYRSKYVSLGSIVTSITLVLLTPLFYIDKVMMISTWPAVINLPTYYSPTYYLITMVIVVTILVLRHKDNIIRLKNGTERKIGTPKN